MTDDAELLDAWADGDETAGSTLVRRHYPSLFGFFRNKIDGPVEDLAQRTFLACIESRERYRAAASFRAYLFGIARKQLLRWFRERSRDNRVVDFEQSSVEDLSDSASAELAMHEMQKVMAYALRQIPLDLQIAVELYYWEGMSTAEVATATDVAPGTVKSRLARARELLRERIVAAPAPRELLTNTLHRLDAWARDVEDAQDER